MSKTHFLTPSRFLPAGIGVIHFVGIGGIGMSGIAEILHNLGYKVAGSDTAESGNVARLRGLGIAVTVGHAAENIAEAAVVVKSTAVQWENPEIVAARRRKIPVVRRSEMLAELTRLKATVAIAGTHGKTTTTSLVAHMLAVAGMDPTVINGGIINAYGTNARLGKGDWLVAEADESDGTFVRIPATLGVVTNIDPEHLDYWESFDKLKEAFRTFVENLPFYGFAVLCADHPEVRALAASVRDRRVITYGITHPEADIRAANIRHQVSGSLFDVTVEARVSGRRKQFKDVPISVPGVHNVQNALAAIGVALGLKIEDRVIVSAFGNFEGVKRRFTRTGEANGVTVIDDYGHHPVEIAATLATARAAAGKGRVIAVVQPHRYTRLSHLFDQFASCFKDADKIIVSEVYSAGEKPIEGVHRDALVAALRKKDKDAIPLSSPDDLARVALEVSRPGDIVVCLGAGSITTWAQRLPGKMAALSAGAAACG